MFDRGRTARFDLTGHALLHTAPNVRKVDASAENPIGYVPMCIGTTTSQRMERFTRPLMERCGARIIVGKGGMGPETLRAFRELGGAYLAVVGGAAALETTWIEAIEDVDIDDLHPESIWRFRIHNFGPLLVDDGCARRLALRARPGRCRRASRRDPRHARRIGVTRESFVQEHARCPLSCTSPMCWPASSSPSFPARR